MAKIERKKAEIFAENAQAAAYGVSQFGSLKAGTPNFTKDLDTIQALPAYKEGWHSATVADQSPALEDRNALDYVNSRQIAYLLQQGIPEWLGTETYYTNAYVVGSDGKLYHAKAQSTNQNPVNDTANTYWEPFTSGGSSLPLFFSTWSDHLFEDTSWLRADTFSWQSGSIYTSAYQHLVDDIDGITAETETISGTTITFYRATDGHKICLANQESNVTAIYNATGVAWYYILDTTNQRFKLPRMLPLGDNTIPVNVVANGAVSQYSTGLLLQNSNGDINYLDYSSWLGAVNPALAQESTTTGHPTLVTDLSKGRTASDGAYKYLYFYVGNTVQGQTTIDVGEITEALNGKVDLPTGRTQSSVGLLVESYVNGTSWYRVYSDGWCEQGGRTDQVSDGSNTTVTFLKPFSNTNYNAHVQLQTTNNAYNPGENNIAQLTTTGMRMYCQDVGGSVWFHWEAKGYIS